MKKATEPKINKAKGRPKSIKPKVCKLNFIDDPGRNYVTEDDHTKIMEELPIYCKAHPEDHAALTKLFQHTYTHLHSFIYQDKESNNYNRKFDTTQEDYMQECFIWFMKRLAKFDPKRCRNKGGWFGVARYIKLDTERALLNIYRKHIENGIETSFDEKFMYSEDIEEISCGGKVNTTSTDRTRYSDKEF